MPPKKKRKVESTTSAAKQSKKRKQGILLKQTESHNVHSMLPMYDCLFQEDILSKKKAGA